MAKETAKASIYLDGKQAEAALDAMSRRAKDLKKDFDAAQKAGDQIKMNKLEKQIRDVESAQRSLRKESFDTQKVLQNLNGSSFNDLTKALKQSQRELKRMGETDPGYKDKLRNVVTLKTRVKELSDQQAVQTSLWGKMANGANKYFNMITLGIATLTGVIFSLSQFVKGMVGLDDELANVQKTTGLTRKEVREMYQDFKNLNTRTPRAELLALAEEAGRLGKTGKKDIMDFVEVANKIKISLGDDLGGDAELAIREVGKLTEIFRVGNQYGTDFKTSMEKVGSGLNEVANNSNASAEYLIEYMKRLGGISTQAKISAADIMGYASTFDQLGQNVEMAATAQSKIIIDMFTDPSKYAKIAKMEVGAFSKLLKTDANEAFIQFLEGLNGNNEGLSVMATKLDGLGIDGARATQALASLSSNTKMLREQQDLANGAMEKGVSLNNEYAIKNDNLAGSWAKLTAFINAQFINSNLLGFLENVIGKLAKMIEVTHPLTKAMRDEALSVNMLSIELTNSNTPAQRRNEIYEELKRIAPDVVSNIDAENISISTLRVNLEKYNAEMIKKLALQDSEETLADKREAAGKATNERIENELKLQKEMNSLLQTYKSFDPKIAKEMEDILFSNATTLDKYKKIVEAVGNVNFSPKIFAATVQSMEEEKAATDAVNESLGAYMERYEMVFGKDKPAPTPPPPPPPPGGGIIPLTPEQIKAAAEARKKASDKAISVIEDFQNQEIALVVKKYTEEGMTDAEFKNQQEAIDVKYLIHKQSALQQHGQSTVDIDKQINDKRIQAQKAFNDAMSEVEKDYLKKQEDEALTGDQAGIDPASMVTPEDIEFASRKHSLDEWVAYLIRKTKEQYNIKKKAVEDEKDMQRIREEIQDAQIGGIEQIAGALAGMFEQGSAAQIAFFALEKAMAIAQIWINYARESSAIHMMAATMGPAGIAWEALMQPKALLNAGINTAIISAQAVAQVASSKRSNDESFSGGGDTGPGGKYEVAGLVHKREYVIPSEGTENPQLRPFIDLIEIARRNGSLARLDLRPVVASISSGSRAYSSGGDVGSSRAIPSDNPLIIQSSGISDTTAKQFTAAVEKFLEWKPEVDIVTFKKKSDNYDKIANGGLK